MKSEQILTDIEALHLRMREETVTYKLAIKEGATFDVAKKLLNKRMKTLKEIISLTEEYEKELLKENETLIANQKTSA